MPNWWQDSQGIYTGGIGLHLSARDMAKFGFLYLNNGQWGNQQILPRTWVMESTRKQVNTDIVENQSVVSYGYQWWIKEIAGYKSFQAIGRAGQFIIIFPELDVLIVMTSKSIDKFAHYRILMNMVVHSIKA